MTCAIAANVSATTTNCPCSLTDALHWVAMISEDAYRDANLRHLLPAALAHYDLIAERESA